MAFVFVLWEGRLCCFPTPVPVQTPNTRCGSAGVCAPLPPLGRPRRELGPAPLQFPGPGVRTPLRTGLVSGGARGTRGAPLPAPGPSQRLPVSPHRRAVSAPATPGRWRGDTAGRRLPGSRRSPARPQVREITPRGRALQSGTPGTRRRPREARPGLSDTRGTQTRLPHSPA